MYMNKKQFIGWLSMLLCLAFMVSCSEGNSLNEGASSMSLVLPQEGGVYSISVSNSSHIEYVQDENSQFYKESKGLDSIVIENEAYNYFAAFIKGQKLFLRNGKNKVLKEQVLTVVYNDNGLKKIRCTIPKADSCIVEQVKYGNPVKTTYKYETVVFKMNSVEVGSSRTLYPLSNSCGTLSFRNVDNALDVLPLGIQSFIDIPRRNAIKDDKLVFDRNLKVEIRDDFWKEFSYTLTSDEKLSATSIEFDVEYEMEEMPIEIIIHNFSQRKWDTYSGIAILSYPTGVFYKK